MTTTETTPPGLPKLRGDLIISPQNGAFVAKDPRTGRFYSFGEIEHFVARHLDGSTPADVVRQRVEERFATPLASGTVEAFIDRLRRLGLVETGQEEVQPPPRARRRGSLLYFRLKAFDPDRLLDRLVGKVRCFFTPYFVALSASLILLAFIVTAANREEIGRDLVAIYGIDTLVLAWVTILAVTTAHEFAHGLTCKRFGGQVHEMGFLLIYFQLAFYCNVSDAWLFPEKSKRLWVTFAGPYFELFLWALATLIWQVTEPGTAPNSVALVVMATSGIKLFFNLNPLIKLDGYYLLSDALGIPNLRGRAFSYLGALVRRCWSVGGARDPDTTPRERRIYLAYGLLAWIYSFWLLGYVALMFGGFLVERYQGAGFLLYAGLLTVVFQNPLKRALHRPPAPPGSAPRRTGALKRPATILLVSALGLAVLFFVRMELKVSGEFTVLPLENADVRAQIEGIIEKVYLDEGDVVKAGDLIVRLLDRDYRSELRKVEAAIDEKRAKLKMLQAGTRPEEIQVARGAVATATTRLDRARRRVEEAERMRAERLAKAETTLKKGEERLKYGRTRRDLFDRLYQRDLVSLLQFEEAKEEVAVREKELEEAGAELKLILADDLSELRKSIAVAENELKEAQGKLKLALAGSRPEEIEAATAELARQEAERRHLEEQLQLLAVVSPISGMIMTPKLREKVGQHVGKGDVIAEVNEIRTIKAEIAISEKDIRDVNVGRRVVLKARAYPGTSFSGRVVAVAPAAIAGKQEWYGKVFRVMTEIDNPDRLLRPEMTGMAKISCGPRPLFDLVTRRLARYVRVEFWSWW